MSTPLSPLSIPCPHSKCGHPDKRVAGAFCRNITSGRVEKEFHTVRIKAAREIASDRGLPFTAEAEVEIPRAPNYWQEENRRNMYRSAHPIGVTE